MFRKFAITSPSAIAFLAIGSAFAVAGDLPPSCMSPMGPNEPDPNIRNLVYVVLPDKSINVTSCIVSNRDHIALTYVHYVFDAAGNYAGYNGVGAVQNLGPVVDATPGHPKIVFESTSNIIINPKNIGTLYPTALFQLTWAACTNVAPAPCDVPTALTQFLRPLTNISLASKEKSRR